LDNRRTPTSRPPSLLRHNCSSPRRSCKAAGRCRQYLPPCTRPRAAWGDTRDSPCSASRRPSARRDNCRLRCRRRKDSPLPRCTRCHPRVGFRDNSCCRRNRPSRHCPRSLRCLPFPRTRRFQRTHRSRPYRRCRPSRRCPQIRRCPHYPRSHRSHRILPSPRTHRCRPRRRPPDPEVPSCRTPWSPAGNR
jgi:hypothetical protein